MTLLNRDLTLAHRLADAARGVSLSYFRKELRQRTKPDGSLVTEADEAVEDELRRLLGEERPDDAVLGEERGQTGSGGRRWVIDGIDGTDAFAAGTPEWGTLIALEIQGEVVIGVTDQPVADRRYWAVRGQGARCSTAGTETQLQVTRTDDLRSARSYVPESFWQRNDRDRATAQRLAEQTNARLPSDHPALQVASGGYDVAIFFMAGPWDLAAPSIIVEEAGGRFSDFSGGHDFTSGTAVFSNGTLHEAVLDLIAVRSTR